MCLWHALQMYLCLIDSLCLCSLSSHFVDVHVKIVIEKMLRKDGDENETKSAPKRMRTNIIII